MKPFWKPEYRDQFLELAGLWLLYAFILSICANPFIMYFIGLDKFYYVTIENGERQVYFNINATNSTYGITLEDPNALTTQQQEFIAKYKVVDDHYIYDLKEFETRITWITITALLGWCVTSPRFNRGWPKIIKLLKDEK